MTTWTPLHGTRQFSAWIKAAALDDTGDVAVTLHPERLVGNLLDNANGVANPDGHIVARVDVRDAHRDGFVKRALVLSGRREVTVVGEHVDRDGLAAIQPLDALAGLLRPEEYPRSALELIAQLKSEADGVRYEDARWVQITRLLAAADTSVFEKPPRTGEPRAVTLVLPWSSLPTDEPNLTWKPQWKLLSGVAENVRVIVTVDESKPNNPRAKVFFTLEPKPHPSVLMADLALYWAPVPRRNNG